MTLNDPQIWTLIGVFTAAILGGFTLVITTNSRVIRGEIAGLRGELTAEMRGEFGKLRGELGGLRGELGELRGEVRALSTRVDGLDRDVQAITDRMWRGDRDS
jgi:hypothetical protein